MGKTTHRNLSKRGFMTLIVAILFFAFILHIDSVEIWAASDSGNLTDTISWSFEEGTLTISGTGAMPNCEYDANTRCVYVLSYYATCSKAKRVIIEEGITAIGDFNFWEFKELQSVSLPSTLKKIGTKAFQACFALTKITFPDSLTSIEGYAFERCIKLKSATLPNSLTKLGESAFMRCYALKAVNLSTGLSQIKYGTFFACGITKLKIPSNIKKIGESSFANTKLKTIDIPKTVKSIGSGAFDGSVSAKVIIRNKSCKIYDTDGYAFPRNSTVYGYRNSTAEKFVKKYGKQYGYKFKLLSSKTVAVKTVKFVNPPKTLKVGKSKTLKVKIAPSNASDQTVTWSSSNQKYATVNSKGKVTAKKAGKGKKVKITAKVGGKKATTTIKIV